MGWIKAVAIPLLPPRLSKKPSVLIGAPRLRTKGCHTARVMLENRPVRKEVMAMTRRFWLALPCSLLSSFGKTVNLLILGPAFPVQLQPPVPPTRVRPVCLLLVQPGFHADALYPPQVLQHRQVGAPDGIVSELDDARAGEIIALSAAFEPPLGDAAIDVAGTAVGPRGALAAVAAAAVADAVHNEVAANAAVETARGGEVISIVWHLVLLWMDEIGGSKA
jgi:hypothetical protein